MPQPWELARKIQLAPIGSRPRTFQRAIDEPCTLPQISLRVAKKTKIFTFGVALHFFVAGNRRHFKLNMLVEHGKSQPTDDKLSLKGAWSLSSDLFNFWKISDNISKTVRDSLIVSIKFEQEVVCILSNGYVADDLGWPLSMSNHLSFYILHCHMHLRNWRSQRLQIWCKGWMCKSQPTEDKLSLIGAWSGHVTHCKFLGFNHISERAEPKVVKFCTRVGNINSIQQDDISPTKGRGYSHVTVLKLCH